MRKSPLRLQIAAVSLLLGAAALALPAPAAVRPENKWRIQCSESAKSDGTIVFRVITLGAEPIDVGVAIADGTGENAVARRIRDALRERLPWGEFQVETDDGEDVLVKRRLGESKFVLQLVRNDVRSVRINLDRE
jgi:hypothetical protein